MTVSAAFFSQLKNDAGVAAIVADRIYPGLAPSDVRPFISYQVAHNVDESISGSPVQRHTVTITCEALNYTSAAALLAAATAAVNRQVWNADATTIRSCILEDSDESSFSEDGNPERIYHTHELMLNVLAEDD